MCNHDCFNCTKKECDATGDIANAEKCKRWYDRHREAKLQYQREYQRKYRERKRLERNVS